MEIVHRPGKGSDGHCWSPVPARVWRLKFANKVDFLILFLSLQGKIRGNNGRGVEAVDLQEVGD